MEEHRQTSGTLAIRAFDIKDLLLLFVLGSLWGASYLFIKVTVAEVPALTLVAGRLLLGAVILWILLGVSGQAVPRGRKLWGSFTVMGLLSGALPFSLISWGEEHISSGLAALLQGTTPIFTVILAQLLSRDEKITRGKALGIVFGFVGVGLLLLPDMKLGGPRAGFQLGFLGQLAVIASSISYAGAALFARSQLRDQPALASTTGQLTMGALLVLPMSLVVDRPFALAPSWPALASWASLTILGTVVAYLIYYTLIGRTSATFVSTVTYIIPVNGLVLGAIILGEPFGFILVISLALILLGILLVRG